MTRFPFRGDAALIGALALACTGCEAGVRARLPPVLDAVCAFDNQGSVRALAYRADALGFVFEFAPAPSSLPDGVVTSVTVRSPEGDYVGTSIYDRLANESGAATVFTPESATLLDSLAHEGYRMCSRGEGRTFERPSRSRA